MRTEFAVIANASPSRARTTVGAVVFPAANSKAAARYQVAILLAQIFKQIPPIADSAETDVLLAAVLLANAIPFSSSLAIPRTAEYVIVIVPLQRCVPTVNAVRPATGGMRPEARSAESRADAIL